MKDGAQHFLLYHFSFPTVLFTAASGLDLLEEIVALIVNEDECGEVFHLNLPNSFHAEFGIFYTLDALNVVLRKDCGRTTDRTEVETAVLLTSVRYLL